MLIDAREVPDGSVVDTDVCVVGGGPAGLTLVRELARNGTRVALLESGAADFDAPTQSLCDGNTTGDPFKNLGEARRRQLGGTANLWDTRLTDGKQGFRGAPLDPIDFEQREWIPHSGWPFSRTQLDPFYARAQKVCGFGPYDYSVAAWQRPDSPPLPLDPEVVATGILQFGSQSLFTQEYPAEIARSSAITAYLHANVVEIETGETGAVATSLRVACLNGGGFRVRARYFVLATGGIENARLLLISDRVQRGGLGNQHDVVGRYFMEHQYIWTGRLTPHDRSVFDRAALYDERDVDGAVVMGNLHLTAAAMRSNRLLHSSLALVPQHKRSQRFSQEAVDSFSTLVSSALHLRVPENAGGHLREVLGHIDYVAIAAIRKASRQRLFKYRGRGPGLLDGGGWWSLPDKSRRFAAFDVILHGEQAPDPENRVKLGDDRDALGCRKATLQWRWRERDIDNALRSQALLAAEISKSGFGVLRVDLQDGRPTLMLPGLHHHMGTTRMHPDPKQGVVDANCRVHGVANLFVAGCSVFPTGGYINPTLTIVALAIRTADHVGEMLASSEPGQVAASAALP